MLLAPNTLRACIRKQQKGGSDPVERSSMVRAQMLERRRDEPAEVHRFS